MVWRILKLGAPCSASIRNQDVELALILLDGFYQSNDLLLVGDIGGDADSFSFDSWKCIELYDGLVDSLCSAGFACSNEDFLCAGAEECGCCVETESSGT